MSRLRTVNLRNLTHPADARHLPRLPPVSINVDDGECLCIAGASGSGKTLFLRAVADLDPSSGNVYLDDVERCRFTGPAWRRRVAYLAAEPAWWAPNVRAHLSDVSSEQLAALGFTQATLDRPVDRLSTGERQRLALLRLLARQPQALLLDEPTAALDRDAVTAVERLVHGCLTVHGMAVLWVTHDRAQIRRLGARVLHLPEATVTPTPQSDADYSS